MMSLTIFWCVLGGLLATLGFYLIYKSRKGKDYTVLGIALLAVGILVAIGAELNLYVNGTQEDLVRFMFWIKD
ncbi:phosphocarrier protein HPr domain protein [Enterococcus faecium]|uniref:phosphocarrier protein HPr domain protein n=2 Tax=Enterococcus faecium TaxID=1352 RepID=UPI000BBC215D|nr:phosphocarrier protein HPr domain protein [Enterococcus faecium]EGP0010234.1 phosphocarrier protein HPr domain protein [Enterococcus faecium]EGP4879319.1 phosphocarrier protein HPr domain protein [Enterococcus faecium]EGP4907552.1 phosphocarrier protein HPr domain protein [Enterococcus faecium]EGP4947448.1 phosphocarrier protein HPr domain protein [Enterococcus faecium]EGP5021761.1 phosphocarrier protein HPr domain protein [Enterococcus faecium]